MEDFTPIASSIGGILIGISASMLLLFNGRIAGISGIFSGVLLPRAGELGWRAAFLGGTGARGTGAHQGGQCLAGLVRKALGVGEKRESLGEARRSGELEPEKIGIGQRRPVATGGLKS